MSMVVEPVSQDAPRSNPDELPQHMALHCVHRRSLPDAVRRFAQETVVPERFDMVSVKQSGRDHRIRRGDTR